MVTDHLGRGWEELEHRIGGRCDWPVGLLQLPTPMQESHPFILSKDCSKEHYLSGICQRGPCQHSKPRQRFILTLPEFFCPIVQRIIKNQSKQKRFIRLPRIPRYTGSIVRITGLPPLGPDNLWRNRHHNQLGRPHRLHRHRSDTRKTRKSP